MQILKQQLPSRLIRYFSNGATQPSISNLALRLEEQPALALSAGGARGAYQIGCWKALAERGTSFAAVAGSSIGALNSAFVCQGDVDRAWGFWEELGEKGIVAPDRRVLRKMALQFAVDLALLMAPVPNMQTIRIMKYALAAIRASSIHGSIGMWRRQGLINLEKLTPMLDRHLDLESVREGPVPLYVTAFGLPALKAPRGKSMWFKLQELDDANARKAIAASISLPVLFPSVEVNGVMLRDGGLSEWVPIRPLYDNGYRKIIMVATKPAFAYKPDNFPGCQVLVIKPSVSLGRFPLSTLRFTKEAVLRWMNLGYEDAKQALREDGNAW